MTKPIAECSALPPTNGDVVMAEVVVRGTTYIAIGSSELEAVEKALKLSEKEKKV